MAPTTTERRGTASRPAGTRTCELRFAAMGTQGHIVVVGGSPALAAQGARRVAELEGRWSRFRSTSELSAINRAEGTELIVSDDTVTLVEIMVRAWHATGGRFDPTLHDAIVGLGYGTDWIDVEVDTDLPPAAHSPGCAGIEVDRDLHRVRVPNGVHLDPGGLGKGLAADLVAGELMAAGAQGVLVNIGGDIRTMGTPPSGESWLIDVEDPHDPAGRLATVAVADGGVATSASWKRHWSGPEGERHHLIDPFTGRPMDRTWGSVTVVATTAWYAKQAFFDGELDRRCNAAAMFWHPNGSTRLAGDRPEVWIRVEAGTNGTETDLHHDRIGAAR